MRELDHFNFVELMLADDAAGVTTSGACFATEAWAERTVFHWQIFFAEDLVAMIVGDRNLCSWDQIVVGVLKMEHIFCEFGSWPVPKSDALLVMYGGMSSV